MAKRKQAACWFFMCDDPPSGTAIITNDGQFGCEVITCERHSGKVYRAGHTHGSRHKSGKCEIPIQRS